MRDFDIAVYLLIHIRHLLPGEKWISHWRFHEAHPLSSENTLLFDGMSKRKPCVCISLIQFERSVAQNRTKNDGLYIDPTKTQDLLRVVEA